TPGLSGPGLSRRSLHDAVPIVGLAGGVIQVLVADRVKAQHAGAEVHRRLGGAVAPVDDHRVTILGARVGEAAAQGDGVVLVDGAGTEVQAHVGGRHVVDLD